MSALIAPAPAAPSVAEHVFEALRRAIITGQLGDGAPLRQEELASRFHTSRIPVREALTRLEQHGLVQIKRFHGYTVAGLSRELVEEICHFRALLESELIAQAVPRLSAAALAEAKKRCQRFSKEDDPVRWGDLNRDFHCALYQEAQMPYHLQSVVHALDKTERYLVDQLRLTDGRQQARSEHVAILDACVAGDARAAAKLTRQHILGACERYSEYMDSLAQQAPSAAAGRKGARRTAQR